MNIKRVLLNQYELYPKMQIQDMVKLIYQQEFAGGHLIADKKESMQKLQEESRAVKSDLPNRIMSKPFEEIGNGLCRLNLNALHNTDVDLETVNHFFFNTANAVVGSIQRFEEKLDILRQCCEDNDLPYSLKELDSYLSAYKSQGFPPVSHSEIYRAAYSPAYRIIKNEYRDYFEVFCRIDSLLRSKDIVSIGIDGKSGAGKSSLAALLSSIYECNVFHMDDYFLTPELKTPERMQEVGGNVDYVRFRQEVINGLNKGCEFQYRKYDCKEMAFNQVVTIKPNKLNIIEGSYSMHPSLVQNYDLKIFLNIEEEEQSRRILKRNGESMHKRFIGEWIPMENLYFEEMKIQEQCDLVYSR